MSTASTDRSHNDACYSDAETERRANATLKRMLATPPKLHKDSKLGRKPKGNG
jgi:hypothetical protein